MNKKLQSQAKTYLKTLLFLPGKASFKYPLQSSRHLIVSPNNYVRDQIETKLQNCSVLI